MTITFMFSSWEEEITNEEYADYLQENLKAIHSNILISANSNKFKIQSDLQHKDAVLKVIAEAGYYEKFKSSIKVSEE